MALQITNFIKKIGELLWVPVRREIGYLVHYKRNIESVNAEVEKLENIRHDKEVLVKAAELNGQIIKSDVKAWCKVAGTVIDEVKNLKDKAAEGENKKCFGGWCSRYKLSKQAVKKTETSKVLQEQGNFDAVALQVKRSIDFKSVISGEEFMKFESTRKAMDEVMEALKDERVKIVGVHGMGGVGKTTMVNQVAVQAHEERLFDHVIRAVVKQKPNLRQIQGQLADMLALKLDEETESGRAGRLKDRIMSTKKILVILDDLWKRIELFEIGIPSGSDLEVCESKIILTTRMENVCSAMESQAKIHLNLLSEPDSEMLFMSKAGKMADSGSIADIATRVAKQCGRLPIALEVVARALRDKDLEEWLAASQRLSMSVIDDDKRVVECIKLSYDYLEGNDRKSYFLICCLFPEDSDINMDDLVKYGIGQGLFQNVNTIEKARTQARNVATYLRASSLLLESEVKGCVKMHDVVRDIGISIASSAGGGVSEHTAIMVEAGCGLTEWPRKDDYQGYTAISLMSNEISQIPTDDDLLVCSKLRTLLLQNNPNIREIPDAFFEGIKSLRVLDLSRLNIPLIPSSIGLLTNLRTLCLDNCKSISDISKLGVLRKLEILSLTTSRIEELPQEIGQLINLRMLDLTMSNKIKRIPPKVISSLSRLEELYMNGSFANWGQAVAEGTNAGLDEIICLPRLNILKVDIEDAQCVPNNVDSHHPKWVQFDICISKGMFTRSMNVHLSKVTGAARSTAVVLDITIDALPHWFNKVVIERAENLIYMECRGLDNIVTEYDRGRLSGLKSIFIQQCNEIIYLMNLMNFGAPVFENLVVLRVHHMEYLKQLCVGQLPFGSLAKLKLLEVQQCNELVHALVQSNLLQRLQKLEILDVGSTSSQEVLQCEGLELEEGEVILPKLREMKLENLPKLTTIWKGPPRLAIFHDLKILVVVKCKKLKNLFTLSVARCLLQLEVLWIEDCSSLVGIIGIDEGDATVKGLASQSKLEISEEHEKESMDKNIFPQLKTLLLQNLPNLMSFYSEYATIECSSLEQLHLQACPNLRTSDFHSCKKIQVDNEQHFILLRRRLWELRQIS